MTDPARPANKNETFKTQRYATSSINVTLPEAGEPESLSFDRNIEINTAAPFVLNTTSTQPNGTYTTGAVIGVVVRFSAPVVVVHDGYPSNCGGGDIGECGELPMLELDASGEYGDRNATYASGNGTEDLVFEYEASQTTCVDTYGSDDDICGGVGAVSTAAGS